MTQLLLTAVTTRHIVDYVMTANDYVMTANVMIQQLMILHRDSGMIGNDYAILVMK